jgi:hypothetical protein
LAEGDHLLDRVVMSFPRYLLASTYRPGSNVDVPAGSWYSPDMTAMPFDMGPPIRMLLDGYHYHETDELRDPAKHLGLWRVRLG